MDLKIDYNEQMLSYYPDIIKSIREFPLLIKAQSLQIEDAHQKLEQVNANIHIGTADEYRIEEWERLLGIVPLPQGDDSFETWLEDRRETISARLYNPEKLNSKSISI